MSYLTIVLFKASGTITTMQNERNKYLWRTNKELNQCKIEPLPFGHQCLVLFLF